VTEDFTMRNNIVRHVPSAIKFCAVSCDGSPTPLGRRFLIQNNLFDDVRASAWGGSGVFFQTISNVPDLVINHNTVIHDGSTFTGGDGGSNSGFQFTNNIVQRGPSGFKGSNTSDGVGTLNTYFPGSLFTKNLLAGAAAGSYPVGNFFPSSYAAVGFVDFSKGDYRLGPTSLFRSAGTDGKDPGADINAVNAATVCAQSGQCSAVPPSDVTAPAISAVAAGSLASSQAVIGWSTNENADSQVEYGPTVAYGSATTLNPAMITSHSQGLSNLFPSTLYHYRVRSKDANGNLAMSGDLTFATLAAVPPPDTTPPVLSSVTNALVSAVSATVSWITNEIADTQLEYGLTTAYGSIRTDAALVASHALGLSGLSASRTYHYRVKSRDVAGNLATSGDFTFTTLASAGGADTTGPSSPTSLALSNVTTSQITIGWRASTDNVAVAGYRLDVATDSSFTSGGSFYKNVNLGNVASFTVNNLYSGTLFYFRLRAYDAAGNTSANSVTVSAHT
jgi:chitodextrinase